MDVSRSPYQKLILVCTNQRGPERASCGARDSGEIHEALKRRVAELGLPGVVRVSKTGCLDLCGVGPVVLVFPDGILYSGVRIEDLDTILMETFGPSAGPAEPLA